MNAQSTQSPPLTSAAGPWALDLLLLERTSYGFSRADLAELRQRGPWAYLEWQLEPDTIDDSYVDAELGQFPALTMSGQQLFDTFGFDNGWLTSHQLRGARILRAVSSRRQLYERMVEFWTDHLNVPAGQDDAYFLKVVDDRDVIRPHALGNFRDMLRASSKSAAMLSSLDNDSNELGAPNENYSREVMELHSLGVDGGYTEDDVRELARCFTGWTFNHTWEPNYGEFRFDSWRHDDGPKTVLGVNIPAGGGLTDGELMIDFLALHPQTAKHLATKLTRWLLSYDPPKAIVDRAAAAYLASGGEIKPMVRVILSADGFARAKPWENRKFKRPAHFAFSLLRALEAPQGDLDQAPWSINNLGQHLYSWPAPNGYPDSAGAWGSNLLPRWTFASHLCIGWLWWNTIPQSHLVQLIENADRSDWAKAIDLVLTGGRMTVEERAAVQSFVDNVPFVSDSDLGQAFEVAANSPTFQSY